MTRLGYLYEMGRGLAQSDAQAVAWYRMAAEKGDPLGMTNLGSMYAQGRGVPRDDVQAVAWFRKAAEKGDALGMKNPWPDVPERARSATGRRRGPCLAA